MLGASGKGDETEKHQKIRRPTRKRLKTSQHCVQLRQSAVANLCNGWL
jgi:hypothetical protein